jgi:acetyltransferase-like isoleucine patch superfamily enzyme
MLVRLLSRLRRARAGRQLRDFPVAAVARDVRDNLVAYARGPLALRACDLVGKRARCFGRVHVTNGGEIRMGHDVSLGGPLASVHMATARDGILSIGDEVTIEYGASISARTMVSVGARVTIGPYCVISDTDFPLPLALPDDDDPRAIMIGEDVWIGAGVTLMPGIKIGDRATVSPGSVVSMDVPADAIASGSPARVMRIIGRAEPAIALRRARAAASFVASARGPTLDMIERARRRLAREFPAVTSR